MKVKSLAGALAIVLLVAGCNTTGGPKQTVGTLGGAVAGGLLGAQVGGGSGRLIATGAGAVIGAFLGGEIGSSLDNADKLMAERTAQRSLETAPTGTATSWNNPDSGNSGTITPTATYQQQGGQYCRDYSQTIFVDGREETLVGKACRNNDGTWTDVS
ncbi:MAG: RT0821/Lpp0805 family surface protein [Pseudomonadota bacterium]